MRILAAVFLVLGIMQSRCGGKIEKETLMGQNVKADLVVIFKRGTTQDEKDSFDSNTIGRKVPGIEGQVFRSGLEAELALTNVCRGQDGVALKLHEGISKDQYQVIRTAIDASPIVDMVFEQVEPSKISCSK